MSSIRRAVLKSGELPRVATAVSLRLHDIGAEAERTLASARAEAARLVAEARREVAQIHARAAEARQSAEAVGREAGYAAGLEAGRAAGRSEAIESVRVRFEAESGALFGTLDALAREWSARREVVEAERVRDCVVLAIALAQRVVSRASELDATVVHESASKALQAVGRASELAIRVHPGDLERVREFAPHVLHDVRQREGLRIDADERLRPGDVRVETAAGCVDATLARQVERIADELLHAWRERAVELGLLNDAAVGRTSGPGT
ncbi:MAG: hypothetical protein L6Q92_00545 [Phycisphaerae bacterium]|nr:hypothetical protein [Phycisphaerae bacterium]